MADTSNLVGSSICRSCESRDLFLALDLGKLPIANELLKRPDTKADLFDLKFSICNYCGLGQVENKISSERLFKDYRYLSSISSTFTLHAKIFVEDITKKIDIKEDEYVLEIASNDGYLLEHFVNKGIKVLGVEPAQNIAEKAQSKGVRTLNTFFGLKTALQIKAEFGVPKLIVANNVLAHVPDILDFMFGLKELCENDTVITIENPEMKNILQKLQFDSIYHEHFSYLSTKSVDNLSKQTGLFVRKVEEISTHGGSLRYWLGCHTNENELMALNSRIEKENTDGIFLQNSWLSLQKQIEKCTYNLKVWLRSAKDDNLLVMGYGAAAKASTLLNMAEVGTNLLPFIVDGSPEKQGWFMPNMNIPIVSPKIFLKTIPTDILIFPWNISEEIKKNLSEILPGVRFWIAIPEMREIN